MSLRVIMQQIEIGFWDVFVGMLHRSSFLRFVLPRVYRILHTRELYTSLALVFVMAVLGLGLGLVLGVISQI